MTIGLSRLEQRRGQSRSRESAHPNKIRNALTQGKGSWCDSIAGRSAPVQFVPQGLVVAVHLPQPEGHRRLAHRDPIASLDWENVLPVDDERGAGRIAYDVDRVHLVPRL